MNKDLQRFKMILSEKEFNRIEEQDEGTYVIDVHEFRRDETKRMINNIINLSTHPCTITVIHGYNRGTVLLEMIRKDLHNPKIVNITSAVYNPGKTFLEIA